MRGGSMPVLDAGRKSSTLSNSWLTIGERLTILSCRCRRLTAQNYMGRLIMTSSLVQPNRSTLDRRDLFKASAVAAAGAWTSGFAALPASAETPAIEAQEHCVNKGSVRLHLYRKRQVGGASTAKPVLFLVHGSTFSSRGSYDLI